MDKTSLIENFKPNLVFLDHLMKLKIYKILIATYYQSINLIIILYIRKTKIFTLKILNIVYKKSMVIQK